MQPTKITHYWAEMMCSLTNFSENLSGSPADTSTAISNASVSGGSLLVDETRRIEKIPLLEPIVQIAPAKNSSSLC